MLANQIKAIEDFLILSGLLDDDVDLICDFIVANVPKKIRCHKRSKIKRFIENANYLKIARQVDFALELPIYTYTHFKVFYSTNKEV